MQYVRQSRSSHSDAGTSITLGLVRSTVILPAAAMESLLRNNCCEFAKADLRRTVMLQTGVCANNVFVLLAGAYVCLQVWRPRSAGGTLFPKQSEDVTSFSLVSSQLLGIAVTDALNSLLRICGR
jgi:hypothetical protein